MTAKERAILQEIADRPPIPVEPYVTSRMNRWFSALALTLLTLMLVSMSIGAVSQLNEVKRAAARAALTDKAILGIAQGNQGILAELRSLISGGDASTGAAILAVVNDNRRVHGCVAVKTFEGLATVPTCAQLAPHRPHGPVKAPTTTTTTVAGPRAGSVTAGGVTHGFKPLAPAERPCRLAIIICIIR